MLIELLYELPSHITEFVLGGISLWLLNIGRYRWRTRRARRFWRPFLSADTTIVLGRTLDDHGWEPSGLLGIGDALALAEVRQFMLRIGAREPEVAFADKLTGDQLQRKLILIGGPDANTVTYEAVKSIASSLRFGDPSKHIVSIRDTSTSPVSIYPGTADDCGVIICTKNPFDSTQEILILAGSFGHGTLAAARYAISQEFLKRDVVKAGQPLECLVVTDVVRDAPQRIRLKVLRPMREDGSPRRAT